MFSYLRPHHKKTPSNPSSPAEHSRAFEPPLHANSPLDHAHPPRLQSTDPKASSLSLPQIVRVSSVGSSSENKKVEGTENRSHNWSAQEHDQGIEHRTSYNGHLRLPSVVDNTRPQSVGNGSGSQQNERKGNMTAPGVEQYGSRLTSPSLGADAGLHSGRRPTGVRLQTPPLSTPAQKSPFEMAPPKSSKARLNLLNPMSLLARRRTSQAVPQLRSERLVTKSGSDTYDFQIKGKFVHDFSAPRVQRNVSYESRLHSNHRQTSIPGNQNTDTTPTVPQESPASPWSGGNHTPVFTENFDEEQYPAAGPHVRKANDITDLPLPRPPYAEGSARQLRIPSEKNFQNAEPLEVLSDTSHLPHEDSKAVPMKEDDEPSIKMEMDNVAPPAPIPTGRPRKVSESSVRDGMPRHMKSTSSRFSFDMIGAAEQERVMEERHRQKALDKKTERSTDFEEYDEEYDYDEMMDGDDLEERIPGVNADLDEEDDFEEDTFEEAVPGVNADTHEDDVYDTEDIDTTIQHDVELNMEDPDEPGEYTTNTPGFSGFTFQEALAAPLSPYTSQMASTPRDANGEVIGFALSHVSPERSEFMVPGSGPLPLNSLDSGSVGLEQRLEGLGLRGVDLPLETSNQEVEELPEADAFPNPSNPDDDDLYFDDGIIGEQDVDEAAEFDESVFDNLDTDQYGRPIHSMSSLPTLYSPPQILADTSPSFNKTLQDDGIDLATSEAFAKGLAPSSSILSQKLPVESIQSLTQDSLAAYQVALAEAANRAAAEGKFRRESVSTFNNQSQDFTHDTTQQQIGISENVHGFNEEPFSSSYDLEDDFNYDDLMEDDAIIAAANAEALANDFDGFYGQEFNFYSAPGAKEAEFVNGGYFGQRGIEGLGRSKSGRVVLQEPNLTPITERSETSNRNSVMGLSMNRTDIVSPGLAQLASMLREDYSEGDLSLDALMKLRRGAWGGSQASLHSSNAGSPRSPATFDEANLPHNQSWTGSGQNRQPLHLRRNSGFSGSNIIPTSPAGTAASQIGRQHSASGMEIGPPSEPNSGPPSPTYLRSSSALAMDHGPQSPRSPRSPKSPTLGSSLSRRGSVDGYGRDDRRPSFRKHRYTGSAESISYVKEEDPVNGERWILERRRTGDSGEVEVGREVISGGRI